MNRLIVIPISFRMTFDGCSKQNACSSVTLSMCSLLYQCLLCGIFRVCLNGLFSEFYGDSHLDRNSSRARKSSFAGRMWPAGRQLRTPGLHALRKWFFSASIFIQREKPHVNVHRMKACWFFCRLKKVAGDYRILLPSRSVRKLFNLLRRDF